MAETNSREFCSFFCHHNWRWVVEEALEYMKASNHLKCAAVLSENRTKKLPSFILLQRVLKRYSLFRVEVFAGQRLSCAWATSPAFEFLDAKDALYRHLSDHHASEVMPPTTLISFDCSEEASIPDISSSSTPALLKAPLGSGGDSLYFVTSKADVLSIIQAHRAKAERTPGFLDGLRSDYGGSVPSWSLQSVIPSVVLSNERKCQVRAYIILCDSELYLYTNYEVRQPMWVKSENQEEGAAIPAEDIAPTLQADLDFCSNCTDGARPYNLRRSKTHTERMVITEVEGMLGEESTRDNITSVMLTAFRALKPKILSESYHSLETNRDILLPISSTNESAAHSFVHGEDCGHKEFPKLLETSTYQQHIAEMAIIGADLIIEAKSMRPYIVEVNNNPAMPAPHKTMTPKYRRHLVEFAASLILLGVDIAAGKGKEGRAGSSLLCIE